MKKILYVTSSVAMSFFLTGCQNSILESSSEEVSNLANYSYATNNLNSGSFLTNSAVALSDQLAQSGITTETEITQSLIDQNLSVVELDGEEVADPQFISEILVGIQFVNEHGSEAFYKKMGLSEFIIEQLLETEKLHDISGCINDVRYNSLTQKEKDFLANIITANSDVLSYINENPISTQSRTIDNNTLLSAITFGNVGMCIGWAFPPAGPLVGYVLGFAVGLVADVFK